MNDTNHEGFRIYMDRELGADGYPPIWHEQLKHLVRQEAGYRCVRCRHPYISGDNPLVKERDENGDDVWASWSPCDTLCTHGDPVRDARNPQAPFIIDPRDSIAQCIEDGIEIEARWRILTVHHLDQNKANCRWWNLAALCQRCHLRIQRKVQMARVWPWEHTPWFEPYAAGYYAWAYLGEHLTRAEVVDRLPELLALERLA